MMQALRLVNLAIAFCLELAVLIAVCYWGFHLSGTLRVVAGIGAPILFAVLWGVFAAPKASMPLHGAANVAFRIAWFACGAAALVLADRPTLGILLGAVYVLNSLSLLTIGR
jgi:hypothetical protein